MVFGSGLTSLPRPRLIIRGASFDGIVLALDRVRAVSRPSENYPGFWLHEICMRVESTDIVSTMARFDGMMDAGSHS